MSRRAIFFLLLLIAWCFLIGTFWLQQSISNQELLANYAKAWDFFSAAQNVQGVPWWSPMFLGGTSLAPAWSFMLANLLMLAFSIPLGFLIGPKVAMLICMALGALGVFYFLRRYVEDEWCAAIGGGLFLLCPSLLTRAAEYEHFVVVCSMVLLPWAFLGILKFLRAPSLRTAILVALGFAMFFLAYAKTGLMALPVLVLFGATEFFGRPIEQRPSWKLLGLAAGAFTLLAIIPNLPALREMRFVALFELGPFAGWQRAFSTKSAMGWIDRMGWLTHGIDGAYAPTTGNGGTYLGIVSFVVLALALFRRTLHDSSLGRRARTFVALGLFAFWLSFGPKGVLGGQMEFLRLALNVPDFTPAIGWFFLAVQVWIIFRLIPPEWPGAKTIAAFLSAIYLIVPGFQLIEFLPIYKNIRAPFDFYQITGTVCIVFATAIVIRILLAQLPSAAWRPALLFLIFTVAVLDTGPYAKSFFHGQMGKNVFDDFLKAQNFLKNSSLSGRVFPFSGRYFYLLSPVLSGRPLATEAFNNYLQQRGTAILQNAAFLSDEYLQAYMRIAGISHLLIDKTDPDTPQEIQERLRKLFPVGFENTNFLILENKDSLGFGFLAQDFIQADDNEKNVATAALGGARYNLATIHLWETASDEVGLRGRVVEGWIQPKSGTVLEEGKPFEPLKQLSGSTYQKVSYDPPSAPGWLVMNQAWHPDWKAFVNTHEVTVHRAFLGFSAVHTDGKNVTTFQFHPPWWYPICMAVGIFAWVSCVGIGLLGPRFPPRSAPPEETPLNAVKRTNICRSVVIVPTYNEANGILVILDKILALKNPIDVLVVDDGSPDGTADLVKAHPAFGKRVDLLEREKKCGLGSAYKVGFAWARIKGYDAVIEMDADLSHDPTDIPQLISELDRGADAAIGSRYLGGVRVINWPQHRLMLSAFASKFVRLATGLPLSDATSGFKALRTSAIEKIPDSVLKTEGYGFQVELHHALWKSGARIVEVPIIFTERREGQTKMTFEIAMEAFIRVLQLSRSK